MSAEFALMELSMNQHSFCFCIAYMGGESEILDYPKFDSSSAPVCSIDDEWRKRNSLNTEQASFFLTEFSNPTGKVTAEEAIEVQL